MAKVTKDGVTKEVQDKIVRDYISAGWKLVTENKPKDKNVSK